MRNKYPGWIIKEKHGEPAAFKDLRCINGFSFAVRVGYDGVSVFGKNGIRPSFFYANQTEFAKMSDFHGSKGEGFRSYEVGCVQRNGSLWFADCLYNPGILEEDFEDLKFILISLHQDCIERFLPSKKQLNRIQRLVEARGKQFVKEYFISKFPEGNFDYMTRDQAQKIITGLQWAEPRKPLSRVSINSEWIS